MKGHKEHHHRKHREAGGVNEAAEDMREKSENYTAGAKKIEGEAKERKHGGAAEGGKHHGMEHHHAACKCKKCAGGRVERKAGGGVHHHEKMENMKHAKHVGKVEGERHVAHLGRHARKSGGKTGSDSHPFSSARHGNDPPGHKTERETMD